MVVLVDDNTADAIPPTAYTAGSVAQFITDYSGTFQSTYWLTLFSTGAQNLSFIDVDSDDFYAAFPATASLTVSIAGGSGTVNGTIETLQPVLTNNIAGDLTVRPRPLLFRMSMLAPVW